MLNNVPLTGQTLGQTKVPINNNFSTIDTVFAVDHVTYNTAGAGKHNKVTLPVQASSPVITLGDDCLYSLLYASSGRNELFFTNSLGNTYPTTATSLTGISGGWTFLPSGLLMKWGQQSCVASTATVNVNGSGPTMNPIYTAQVTPTTTGAIMSQTTFGATTFVVNCSNNTTANFLWLAIGKGY